MAAERTAKKRRCKRAKHALKPYRDGDDRQSPVIDLLADLQHDCTAKGVDFEMALRVATNHFCDEQAEEARRGR
ncbi:hypothetical protein [Tautonia marina]|uniref:hypothetical protein n=1 Tax=Tautonia marina TaxID=2653855 RepID=UPI0012608581|nr:hypothetical protein [Tautonia marina]